MKRFIYILGLVIVSLVMTVGCKDFLDVTPRTESPRDVMFSTETGFKDALTGVYIQIKNNDLYGKELTFGTMEHLVSSWDTEVGSANQRLNMHDYGFTAVSNRFESIFSKMYSSIANINSILESIDEKKTVFSTQESFRMIKGEALALRAMLHLDLLRLYGPIPSRKDNSPILPYVTVVSKGLNNHVSFDQYFKLLMDDLDEAEYLLVDVDPIVFYSLRDLRNPGEGNVFNPKDNYQTDRALRLNYFAVKALKSRAYLWSGDRAKAYQYAKEVVEAKNKDGLTKFRLGVEADIVKKDFSFINEHIFGLFDFELADKYAKNFTSGDFSKGSSSALINGQIFENSGIDIRETGLWEVIVLANTKRCYVLKKYAVNEYGGKLDDSYQSDRVELKQIPIVRVSELYLTLSEIAPVSEAQTYWSKYLSSRNLTQRSLSEIPQERQSQIMKEFRKEFYGEGQAFYLYKRMEASKQQITFMPATAVANYVIPLPMNEVQVKN